MREWTALATGLVLFAGCSAPESNPDTVGTYLYVSEGDNPYALSFGDVLRLRGGGAQVQAIAETQIGPPRIIPGDRIQTLLRSDSVIRLAGRDLEWEVEALQRHPYTYRLGGYDFWSSFEPVFTGFPEYARPGSLDFVNRMAGWDSLSPGLAYTEYVLPDELPQPVLIIAERQGSEYLESWGVVVDTVAPDGFGGRAVGLPEELTSAGEQRVFFSRQQSPVAGVSPPELIEEINAGYSRSYLLFSPQPLDDVTLSRGGKRLPRRATIDEGDLGNISASFLDDGRFMLLSDDHLILEGNYALDLDKGLLTVEDDAGLFYRIFLATRGEIALTLPVWVLRLEGSRLNGTDNYLRVEVVE